MSEDEQTAIETVDYTMKVPKESKEIVDAQSGLLQHFVTGGSVEGAVAFLKPVMDAVEGYQKVAKELKSKYNDEAVAYLVHKNWEALKGGPDK